MKAARKRQRVRRKKVTSRGTLTSTSGLGINHPNKIVAFVDALSQFSSHRPNLAFLPLQPQLPRSTQASAPGWNKLVNSGPVAVPIWRTRGLGRTIRAGLAQNFAGQDVLALAVARCMLDEIQHKLQYSTWRDWFQASKMTPKARKLSSAAFRALGASRQQALLILYPEASDDETLQFKRRDAEVDWRNLKDCEKMLRRAIGERNAVPSSFPDSTGTDTTTSDYTRLYELNSVDIRARGPVFTASWPNGLCQLISTTFPDHEFQMWRFTRAPKSWWADLARLWAASSADPIAHAVLLDFLSDQLPNVRLDGSDAQDSSIEVRISVANKYRLDHFGGLGEVLAALRAPPSDPPAIPREAKDSIVVGKWKKAPSKKNWRAVLDEVVRRKGQGLQGLYSLSQRDFVSTGAHRWFASVGGSIYTIVRKAFPEHDWKPWKFRKTPAGYWPSLQSRLRLSDLQAKRELKDFIEEVGTQCGVAKPEDWYTATPSASAKRRLRALGPFNSLLATAYPYHKWEPSYFAKPTPVTKKQRTVSQSEAKEILSHALPSYQDWFNRVSPTTAT